MADLVLTKVNINVLKTKHTFLLQEGQWTASGTLSDPNGRVSSIVGTAVVKHTEENWLNQSNMQLAGDASITFSNCYEIEPLIAGMETTIWETEHPGLGLVIGTLAIVDTAIILSYTAPGGYYSGTEIFSQLDAENYQSWGVLWQGDQKVSSWQAQLTKAQD